MKNKRIKISVLVPTFNREKYIGRCIRSLMNQSIQRNLYEIIVINDGSTDSSKKIINSYSEEVNLINFKKNIGLPSALNKGIKHSKGKYFVRVDSDDYVNADFLKILYLFMFYNPKFSAVACDYISINDQEKIINRENCIKKPIGCGIMFKKNTIKKIGNYNINYLENEDKEFRQRFDKHFKMHRISLPLYRYRRHKKSITKGN
jgi:glycosyltransferase involved in cell wall biosynthesis